MSQDSRASCRSRFAVVAAAGIAALLSSVAPAAAETRRALLIGIDKYVPPPTTASRANADAGTSTSTKGARIRGGWTDLDGAVNDVEALRQVLISRFGFKSEDVHALTNAQATRARILSETRTWLIDAAAPGDVSFFYYAGHGSQVKNSKSVEADKMDESIVPADANTGIPDLRDKELAALFADALDKKAVLTVMFDSCHSGSVGRGVGRPTRFRVLPPDERDVADPSSPIPPETRGALVLSAAQDFQFAAEIKDDDNTPHGLFTWALLKTLRSMPVNESADRMFLQLRAIMQSGDALQEPVLAATPERRRAALLGVARPSLSGATVVAVQAVQPDGTVTLQGGVAAGVRKDAELRKVGDTSANALALRVTREQGLSRSEAVAISGSTGGLQPGTLFEVTRWTAPAGPALRVWIAPPDGSAADLVASGLLVNVPLPAEAPARLGLGQGTGNDTIEVRPSPEDADYLLVGRQRGGSLEYAWVRPFVAMDDAKVSALPARTDWTPFSGDPAAFAARMAQHAVRLGVIRTWLQLESPADTGRFPYHLALKNATTGDVRTTGPVHGNEKYGLVLTLDEAIAAAGSIDQRYIYVFAIDSAGKSTLLYPAATGGNVENRLPAGVDDQGRLTKEIALGRRELFTVTPPFGIDTFMMLTSATALPDPSVLEGDAVRSRDLTRGASDPLSRLLAGAGTGKRGQGVTTPTDWSLERLTIESTAAAPRGGGQQ